MEKRSTKWDLTAYPNYEVENLPGYALHLIEEAQAAGKPGNRSRDTIKQVILNKSDIIRLIQKLSNLIIGYQVLMDIPQNAVAAKDISNKILFISVTKRQALYLPFPIVPYHLRLSA